MTWPTVAINTTNLDASGDSPASARADLLDAVQKANAMIAALSTFVASTLSAVDAAAFRTAIAAAAAAAPTISGVATFTGNAFTTPETIAFSSTPTFNADDSNVFEFGALTANVTASTISNPHAGQTVTIRVVQNGTGGFTFTLPSGAAVSGSLNTTASKVSLLTMTYSGVASRWEGSWLQLP